MQALWWETSREEYNKLVRVVFGDDGVEILWNFADETSEQSLSWS